MLSFSLLPIPHKETGSSHPGWNQGCRPPDAEAEKTCDTMGVFQIQSKEKKRIKEQRAKPRISILAIDALIGEEEQTGKKEEIS